MDDLISRQDVFDMIDAVFREECEKRNTTYEEADEMTQWYLCGMMKVMEKVFDIPSAHPLDPCKTCLHKGKGWDEEPCDGCTGTESKYEPDNGWIPVSEGLPEDGKDCLVTEVITNGMKSVLIAKFANDLYKIDKYDFARRKGEHGWFCYDDEYGRYYDVDVLAWMPLPDPYKEEE